MKAWLAVNPDSDLLAAALANGVTHTVAAPSGTRVSGQSGLVQTGGDRIEDAAHHLRRDRHAADAITQQHGHRREQNRRTFDRETGVGKPESVHPIDLGEQADDPLESERDAEDEHPDDQGIDHGIGEKCGPDPLVEHDHNERAHGEEYHHPDEKNPG